MGFLCYPMFVAVRFARVNNYLTRWKCLPSGHFIIEYCSRIPLGNKRIFYINKLNPNIRSKQIRFIDSALSYNFLSLDNSKIQQLFTGFNFDHEDKV